LWVTDVADGPKFTEVELLAAMDLSDATWPTWLWVADRARGGPNAKDH